jgi:hypothetical protein
LLIITYLIPARTQIFTGVLLGLLLILLIYPVFHFVRRMYLKLGLLIFMGLLVFCFGWLVWPQRFPDTSYISVVGEEVLPLDADRKPNLTMRVYNDSIGSLKYHRVDVCGVYPSGVSDSVALLQDERDLWSKLGARIEDDRVRAKGEDDFYWLQLPPKVNSVTAVDCSALTPEQARSLESGAGITIFYLSKFVYYDSLVGERGLENCVFTQGKGLPHHCFTGHNGPARIRKLHWWNM